MGDYSPVVDEGGNVRHGGDFVHDLGDQDDRGPTHDLGHSRVIENEMEKMNAGRTPFRPKVGIQRQ